MGLLAANVALPDQTFPSSRKGRANTTSWRGWPGCRTGAGSDVDVSCFTITVSLFVNI
jgi:hypothetical protein